MPQKPSITPSEAQELPYPYRPDTLDLLDREPRSGIFVNETLLRETNMEDLDSFNMLYAKTGRAQKLEPADEGVAAPTEKKKRRRKKAGKTGLLQTFLVLVTKQTNQMRWWRRFRRPGRKRQCDGRRPPRHHRGSDGRVRQSGRGSWGRGPAHPDVSPEGLAGLESDLAQLEGAGRVSRARGVRAVADALHRSHRSEVSQGLRDGALQTSRQKNQARHSGEPFLHRRAEGRKQALLLRPHCRNDPPRYAKKTKRRRQTSATPHVCLQVTTTSPSRAETSKASACR